MKWTECGGDQAAVYAAMCVHGHVRQGRLCEVHLQHARDGQVVVCLPCMREGLNCRLVGVAAVDVAGEV
ncbi:hypothetical protein ABT158_48605 [Nonomuraea sp. NPDC001636]|uniref:hypothetical protein n=1 Tax=Nonomuraea sp. NPDC001636 TaxID=3154391 RepID=UPI00332BB8BF